MTDGEFVGARDLARILGLDYLTTLRCLERGEIQGIRLGRQWRVHRDELERLRDAAGRQQSQPAAVQQLTAAVQHNRSNWGAETRTRFESPESGAAPIESGGSGFVVTGDDDGAWSFDVTDESGGFTLGGS